MAREVEEDAERVRAAMQNFNKTKQQAQSRYIVNPSDMRKHKLPQLRPTTRQRYANYDHQMGGLNPVFVRSDSRETADTLSPSTWSVKTPIIPRGYGYGSGSNRKKTGFPFKMPTRNPRLETPTHQLNKRATAVSAPRSLIEQYKSERSAATRPAPKPSTPIVRAPDSKTVPAEKPAPSGTSRPSTVPVPKPASSIFMPKKKPTSAQLPDSTNRSSQSQEQIGTKRPPSINRNMDQMKRARVA